MEGSLEALGLVRRDGRLLSRRYPEALGRVWSALECPTSGDVLLSAEPGYEFVDWGGSDHVGGGSHGSLHREDSLGAMIVTGAENWTAPEQWSVRDACALVLDHFGARSE